MGSSEPLGERDGRRSHDWVLREHLRDERREPLRDRLGRDARERGRWLAEVRPDDADRVAHERGPAGEELEEDAAERVDVGRWACLRVRLLGRDVGRRSEHRARARQRALARDPREAEVEQLHAPVAREEHVARLDVPVNDAERMGVRERRGARASDHAHPLDRQGARRSELGRQRASLEELRHEVASSAGQLARVEHPYGSFVIDPGGGNLLASEASPREVGARELGREHLQRDAEAIVAHGPEDTPLSALAEQGPEHIGADAISGLHERERSGRSAPGQAASSCDAASSL